MSVVCYLLLHYGDLDVLIIHESYGCCRNKCGDQSTAAKG